MPAICPGSWWPFKDAAGGYQVEKWRCRPAQSDLKNLSSASDSEFCSEALDIWHLPRAVLRAFSSSLEGSLWFSMFPCSPLLLPGSWTFLEFLEPVEVSLPCVLSLLREDSSSQETDEEAVAQKSLGLSHLELEACLGYHASPGFTWISIPPRCCTLACLSFKTAKPPLSSPQQSLSDFTPLWGVHSLAACCGTYSAWGRVRSNGWPGNVPCWCRQFTFLLSLSSRSPLMEHGLQLPACQIQKTFHYRLGFHLSWNQTNHYLLNIYPFMALKI